MKKYQAFFIWAKIQQIEFGLNHEFGTIYLLIFLHPFIDNSYMKNVQKYKPSEYQAQGIGGRKGEMRGMAFIPSPSPLPFTLFKQNHGLLW